MILKVSHLVLSSENILRDKVILQQLGYQSIFVENNVINAPIKKNLFDCFNDKHDLIYCAANNNIGVELLDWKTDNHNYSNFMFLFDSITENVIGSTYFKTMGQISMIEGFFKGSNALVGSFKLGPEPCQLNKVLVKTDHLEESLAFWELFGFLKTFQDSSLAILKSTSFLQKTTVFYLYVVRTENINIDPCLDNKGISCLSFLSNSIALERELLRQNGFKTFDVGKVTINNKVLNIFFVRGPHGELVEVFDLKDSNLPFVV